MTKKLTLSVVVVAGVLTLSGCQIMPTFFKPVAPLPSSYPISDSASAKSMADTGWNEFFQNPDLREAISAALTNNRDLKTAVRGRKYITMIFKLLPQKLHNELKSPIERIISALGRINAPPNDQQAA